MNTRLPFVMGAAPAPAPPAAEEEVVRFDVEAANAYALHAMMASNAYVDKEDRTYFPVEKLGWRKVDIKGNPVPNGRNSYRPKTIIGNFFSNLQFDIWEHEDSNQSIISFKGTDEKVDWFAANLAVGISVPYKSAKKQAMKYVRRNTGREVALTGHSLGGGLALSVSVWHGLDAIVFNTSPRFFDGRKDANKPALRKAIFQEGEILRKIRRRYPKFLEKMRREDIIQTSFDYGEGNAHRADLLAEGILRCSTVPSHRELAEELPVRVEGCL